MSTYPRCACVSVTCVKISIRISVVEFLVSCGHLFVYALYLADCIPSCCSTVHPVPDFHWVGLVLSFIMCFLSLSVIYFLYHLEYWVMGVDVCVVHLQSVFTHLIYIVTCRVYVTRIYVDSPDLTRKFI
jgi:hypothetical protein